MDHSLIILHLAALLSGISKFSIGGMGALILPLLLIAFPGQQALALLIPMFLVADLLTMACYRHSIDWKVLFKLAVLMSIGCGFGALLMMHVNTHQFAQIIGITILAMLGLSLISDYTQINVSQNSRLQNGSGIFAGFISMTANSAGPVMSLYLLNQNLNKQGYVSTRAWLAGLINIVKIPMLIAIGILNQETAVMSLSTLPTLLIGAFLGYSLLKHISFSQLKWSIRVLIMFAAGHLIAD